MLGFRRTRRAGSCCPGRSDPEREDESEPAGKLEVRFVALRRVTKPGGRLMVGEGLPDPRRVGALRTEAAGLCFESRVGGTLGYFARLRVRKA